MIYEKGEFDAMEIGFFFNPQYQGKGYAKESAAALIDYAFMTQGIRRITARTWELHGIAEMFGTCRSTKY